MFFRWRRKVACEDWGFMRKENEKLEKYRVKTGEWETNPNEGMHGLFFIPNHSAHHPPLKVISSGCGDGTNREHVSVSLPNRTPSWEEMCKIKDLFWGEEETVIQFHPPRSEYVNNHPYCLHLWKKEGENMETPPSILTGIKSL